jgi:hypothetical protein
MGLNELKQRLGRELDALRQEGRYYASGSISSSQGPRITIEGASYREPGLYGNGDGGPSFDCRGGLDNWKESW